MTDAVLVGTVAMGASMGAIVVLGTLGGLLCYWFDKRTDHGHDH